MITQPDKYLLPEEDGLPVRESQEYARYKLHALHIYIEITNTAMRNHSWIDRFFIDLFSGPGKNKIRTDIVLGSPLIALTAKYPFTQYRFNELSKELSLALETRTGGSDLKVKIQIYQDYAHNIVHTICDEIVAKDKEAQQKGSAPTLNLAFLDPEGIKQLPWSVIERLARIQKMDLIINFSTSGLLRSISAGSTEVVDEYFGTNLWRSVYDPNADATQKRRALIDYYRKRLEVLGYNITIDPDMGGHDVPFKNQKNSQVYSLIFAGKHPLADKLWKEAAKRTKPTRRLPGFD